MEKTMHFQNTKFGFEWGAAKVQRLCDDDKRGWVIIEIVSPKNELQIYITKTGKIRVLDKNGEWVKPKEKTK